MAQLSLFAADAHVPEPADLEGVLAAHGQSTLTAATARVAVVVDTPWRADALVDLLTGAGLEPTRAETGSDGRVAVSTSPGTALVPVVRRWRRGAVTAVPDGWLPSPGALRAWMIVAGHVDGGAVDLGIDAGAEHLAPRRAALVAALDRAGIRATYVGSRGGGPLLRLGTARARRRLAETIGAAPDGVPAECWPG